MIVRNVLGHAGVELIPRAWVAGWWGQWLTTTLHHDLHHSQGRHNYGLYFRWWDRCCATEHPAHQAGLAGLVRRLDPLPEAIPIGYFFLGSSAGLT